MSGQIQWSCDECGKVIEDGTGSVRASFAEMRELSKARKEWNAEHPGLVHSTSDITTYPRSVEWRARHDHCELEPEEGYAIAVSRIRDERALLAWTEHLLEKAWLAETNWARVIRRAVDSIGISLSI